MAEVFKNAYLDVPNSETDLYTCPSAKVAIVLTLRMTNVDGTNAATIDAKVLDSDTSTNSMIASTINVPADSTLELAGASKIVLETGDKIKLTASAANDIEAFASILEIDL
ncbi:hypothetical protein [uncultured Mediterranean phage uvMED]|nr:hypothetical protein [uncultured Mediterranean phage uvMED]